MSKNYVDKVVGTICSYNLKQKRKKILELELESKLDISSTIYDQEGKMKNNIYSSVEDAALDRLESEKAEELIEVTIELKSIDEALDGLTDNKKSILVEKYKDGEIKDDIEIYGTSSYPYSKDKYYEDKKKAIKEFAQMMGFI